MPSTSVLLPNDTAASQLSTVTVGGTDYTQIAAIQTSRIKEGATGSTGAVMNSNNQCIFMKNFFNDNQIPPGSTINGIEVVAISNNNGGHSRFGSSGASSGEFKLEWFFHNGSGFSSAITHVGDVSGITNVTSTDSGASLTFSGGNRHYLNNTSGDDVLFGGTSDLSGLSWNVDNQAEFGFLVAMTVNSGTCSAVWSRGIGLRCTYTGGVTGRTCNVVSSTISNILVPSKINGLPQPA